MGQYLPILFMTILVIAFGAGQVLLAKVMGPNKPNAAKLAPYECGIIPEHEPPERFPVRFYLVAMVFIVFDVEIIFLFPYVLMYDRLGVFGLIEMGVFSIAVIACLIFMVANGALEWGPQGLVRKPKKFITTLWASAGPVKMVGSEGRDTNREVAA